MTKSLNGTRKQESLMEPRLPLEILETILEFLSPPHTSQPFPLAFCIIIKLLSSLATRLLYKHIIIEDYQKLSRFKLSLNPPRCALVKHLSIFLEGPGFPLDLLRFVNLKTLSLESESTSSSREEWKANYYKRNRTDPFPRAFPPSLRSLTLGADAFHFYSSTAGKDLTFKTQPEPLSFEKVIPANTDSYHYRNWSFGRSEDEDESLVDKGLHILHLHLYHPPMNSRILTRLRTKDCFPHLESLTLSLPKIAHPDDLRLLRRTLRHLTSDDAWVYGSRRTFSRGLKRITVRVWSGWIDRVVQHLGLRDLQDSERGSWESCRSALADEDVTTREMALRQLDPEVRFQKAIKVEVFQVEVGNWKNARDEEFKRGGWISDLQWG